MKNFLVHIREKYKMTKDDIANLLGVSRMNVYNLEKRDDIPYKYYQKIQHLLSPEEQIEVLSKHYKSTIAYQNSIINTNQINCTNYNNIQKQDNTIISINYYQNIIDLSKNQNAIKLDCPVNIMSSLINNQQIQDYSKIVICKDSNDTYIIDTSNTAPTDKPRLCIVENKIDINNTTCFSAMVRRDVLTNKLIMSIAGQPETELLKTCSIIGVVLCKTL